MRLDVELADGSTQTVVTDPLVASDRPTARSASTGIYFGETYDATKEMPGWDRPGFAADGLAAGPGVAASRWRRENRARGPIERTDSRGPGVAAGQDDRTEAGRLRVRHGPEHGRLVPA